MNIEEIITQIALMAVGGVSTWTVWVTKRHLKMKCDLNQAFKKIRAIEKELKDGCRLCSEADDRDSR
jgi:hypothetical protein